MCSGLVDCRLSVRPVALTHQQGICPFIPNLVRVVRQHKPVSVRVEIAFAQDVQVIVPFIGDPGVAVDRVDKFLIRAAENCLDQSESEIIVIDRGISVRSEDRFVIRTVIVHRCQCIVEIVQILDFCVSVVFCDYRLILIVVEGLDTDHALLGIFCRHPAVSVRTVSPLVLPDEVTFVCDFPV